jgi:hypothetical protein
MTTKEKNKLKYILAEMSLILSYCVKSIEILEGDTKSLEKRQRWNDNFDDLEKQIDNL